MVALALVRTVGARRRDVVHEIGLTVLEHDAQTRPVGEQFGDLRERAVKPGDRL